MKWIEIVIGDTCNERAVNNYMRLTEEAIANGMLDKVLSVQIQNGTLTKGDVALLLRFADALLKSKKKRDASLDNIIKELDEILAYMRRAYF